MTLGSHDWTFIVTTLIFLVFGVIGLTQYMFGGLIGATMFYLLFRFERDDNALLEKDNRCLCNQLSTTTLLREVEIGCLNKRIDLLEFELLIDSLVDKEKRVRK